MTTGEDEVVPGRETLVRRRGASWSFHLPDQHRIELTPDRRYATLLVACASTVFDIERIDESYPEEVVVVLGEPQTLGGSSTAGALRPEPGVAYPLPEIQDEFDRLRKRWREAGLSEQEFNSWAQESTNENQLQRLRKKLRDVGG